MYCILPSHHIAHCTDPGVLYVLTEQELTDLQGQGSTTPSNPGAIECTGACTITLQHQLLPEISAADGALISGAILGLWALAFVFRLSAKAIQ